MKRRQDISILMLTVKLVLVCWLFLSFTSMALLGIGHTAAVWCTKHSTPGNPACWFVEKILKIEGH